MQKCVSVLISVFVLVIVSITAFTAVGDEKVDNTPDIWGNVFMDVAIYVKATQVPYELGEDVTVRLKVKNTGKKS